MKLRINSILGRAKQIVGRLTRGPGEFLSSGLNRIKKISKLLAREIVALFVMAIVAGIAISSLIKSFVFDLLMPLIGLASPQGDWQKLQIKAGQTRFNIGSFLAHLIYFILVVLVVFLVLKLMPKRADVALRRMLKSCPSCGELLPSDAVECVNCGTRFLELPTGE